MKNIFVFQHVSQCVSKPHRLSGFKIRRQISSTVLFESAVLNTFRKKISSKNLDKAYLSSPVGGSSKRRTSTAASSPYGRRSSLRALANRWRTCSIITRRRPTILVTWHFPPFWKLSFARFFSFLRFSRCVTRFVLVLLILL